MAQTDRQAPIAAPADDAIGWLEEHGDALFRFARQRVPCDADAEDLVQDTLVAALRADAGFRGDASRRTWLTAILRNHIADFYRRRRRGRSEACQASFDTEGFWHAAPAEQDPLATLELVEQVAMMQSCVGGLPPTLASAYVGRSVEERDASAVCDELGITPANLWQRLHRARLWLRRCIEKDA